MIARRMRGIFPTTTRICFKATFKRPDRQARAGLWRDDAPATMHRRIQMRSRQDQGGTGSDGLERWRVARIRRRAARHRASRSRGAPRDVRPPLHVEFLEQIVDVALHRRDLDAETHRDFLVRQVLLEEANDLALAYREA